MKQQKRKVFLSYSLKSIQTHKFEIYFPETFVIVIKEMSFTFSISRIFIMQMNLFDVQKIPCKSICYNDNNSSSDKNDKKEHVNVTPEAQNQKES